VGFVGGVFVCVPAGDDAGSKHLVGEACEAVAGVCLQSQLHVSVCFGSSAFPPVDVADGGEDGCCMLWAGPGVGVDEQLLCPLDAGPLGCGGCLGEEDVLCWFV
jgi:hypothetical protein